jgi:hypothetical protein
MVASSLLYNFVDVSGAVTQALRTGIEPRFREFVRIAPARKWIIAADFALSDPTRYQDVFAFTVFRLQDSFDELLEDVRRVATSDLKKIRRVSESMLAYLRSDDRFHFCFLTDKRRSSVGSAANRKAALDVLKSGIDATIDRLANASSPAGLHTLERLKELRAEVGAKSFRVDRLNNVQLASVFAAVVTFLLLSSCAEADVVWMPDRGEVADYSLDLAGALWQAHVGWLCQESGVCFPDILSVADATGGPSKKAGWFDELVRIPDYLAGPLSKLDIKNKRIAQPADGNASSDKHFQIIEEVIAPAQNMSIILIDANIFNVRAIELTFSPL